MPAKRCHTARCRNRVKHGNHCSTCRSRKTRQADPVKYAYYNLRNRAKQRNIAFTITLEDFRTWCHKVNYIGFARGRSAESFSIDRKYNDIGYHIDNIQVMAKGENVKKYFSYDYRSRTAYMSTAVAVPEGENPF